MKINININLISFILSFICLMLFLLSIQGYLTFEFLNIHPLYILLSLLLVTFFLGVIGTKDIDGIKASIRFFITIAISIILSILIIYILVIGNLLT